MSTTSRDTGTVADIQPRGQATQKNNAPQKARASHKNGTSNQDGTGKKTSAGNKNGTSHKASTGKKDGVSRKSDTSKTAPVAKKPQTTHSTSAKKEGGKNQKLGKLGEDLASRYLLDKGIVILERNWKCSCGEADIIADEQGELVFIEVKTRSAGYPGLPEYAVNKQKRTRYEKIAISYLMQHQRPSGQVRFDVIAIQMTGELQCLLRHHRDAFLADA